MWITGKFFSVVHTLADGDKPRNVDGQSGWIGLGWEGGQIWLVVGSVVEGVDK